MLGGDYATAIQNTQYAGPKPSRDQQTVEIFKDVSLIETKVVEQVMTISYEVRNHGQQPVRVYFDFAGTQNMNIVSPQEFVGKLTADVYVGVGQSVTGPVLRQHIRTISAAVRIRTEVKVCEKEWGNTTDNIVYRKGSNAAAPVRTPAQDAEFAKQLQELDFDIGSCRRLVNQGNVGEARNSLREIELKLRSVRGGPMADKVNSRVDQFNQLSRDVRNLEVQISGGTGEQIKIDLDSNIDGNLSDIRSLLDSIAARTSYITPQDAPTEGPGIIADLNRVKTLLNNAGSSVHTDGELSQLRQRYNRMAKDIPAKLNSLIAAANPAAGTTTTYYVGERKGFTVNPVTGKKQYSSNAPY